MRSATVLVPVSANEKTLYHYRALPWFYFSSPIGMKQLTQLTAKDLGITVGQLDKAYKALTEAADKNGILECSRCNSYAYHPDPSQCPYEEPDQL